MPKVDADYGFKSEFNQDHYRISYQVGKWGMGMAFLLLFVTVPLAFFGTAFTIVPLFHAVGIFNNNAGNDAVRNATLITFLVLGFAAAPALVFYRNLKRRPTREILVYRDAIAVGKNEYDLAHVTDLYVRSPDKVVHQAQATKSDNTLSMMGATGIFGVAGVLAGGMSAASKSAQQLGDSVGAASASVRNAQKDRTGWTIWLDYGSKPYRIAAKLDERRAKLILNELRRVTAGRTAMDAAAAG